MSAGALAGRRVTIIGGSAGFGLALARQAAEAGAVLFLGGRDGGKLAAVIADLRAEGYAVAGQPLEAGDAASRAAFLAAQGETDHLVSFAGGAMGGGFLANSLEAVRQAVEEKFFLNLALAKAALPTIREGGSLVLTAGSGGRPDTASGAVIGNGAIEGLVRGLALETAPRRRVNAVAPTWTVTELWRRQSPAAVEAQRAQMAGVIPLGRTASPGEVAEAYLFLLGNGFVTGQVLRIDGGISLL